MNRILVTCIALLFFFACGGDTGTKKVGEARILNVSPATVNRGQSNIEGRIYGENLEGMSSISFGDGISIEQTNVLSPGEIYIFFSVSPDAVPGPRTVTLYAVEGVFTLDQGLTVSDNTMPKPVIQVSPSAGYRSTDFRFDASRSQDPDGRIDTYRWNFGDRTSASGKSVVHKYSHSGAFNVTLTVTDNRGASAVAERFVDVAISQPPIASFVVSPTSGTTATNFQFNASASKDPDGRISGYSWNFGDGTSAVGQTASHRFSSTGSYSVSLIVQDNTKLTGRTIHNVVVSDSGSGDDDDDDGGGGGGGGGTCDANNFNTNFFTVLSFSSNTITADQAFRECPGLCGEVRRPGGQGIREFVGDILSINGQQIRINPGTLPASTHPEPGERLNIVWRSCGG